MDQAKYLTQAIQILVVTRKQLTDVDALWQMVNRAIAHLNVELAALLSAY